MTQLRGLVAVLALSVACRQAAPPRRHVVEIRGMAFVPAELRVAPGDTVVWINRDIFPHTATTNESPGWDTGTLAQDQTGLYVAGGEGEQPYRCTLHPSMQGKLIIQR